MANFNIKRNNPCSENDFIINHALGFLTGQVVDLERTPTVQPRGLNRHDVIPEPPMLSTQEEAIVQTVLAIIRERMEFLGCDLYTWFQVSYHQYTPF